MILLSLQISIEEIEVHVSVIGSCVKGCTVTLYNSQLGGTKIEAVCSAYGAECSRVVTVSSVVRMEGMKAKCHLH